MSLLDKIDTTNLPKHLAIIMDGNGRWAKKQGLLRTLGHESGTKSVKANIKTCAKLGIETLPYMRSRPKTGTDPNWKSTL
jgi:undecaprenyl diphosphate synthase